MQWDSPWGRGFPGWHLECSAMSVKYLGERFDIHTGGIDHVPVHHTNERAQNFAAFGHEAVNCWMHNAFLTLGDARMGKSEGNLITISQLQERGVEPAAFRYLCHTALYRMPLNFSEESVDGAKNSLAGLVDFGRTAQSWRQASGSEPQAPDWTGPFKQEFASAVADDLNIPQALAVVWGVVKEGNKRQDRAAWSLLLDFDRVLRLGLGGVQPVVVQQGVGFFAKLSFGQPTPDSTIQKLAQARKLARDARQWAESDRLRDELARLGWLVEDTPQGQLLKPRR